MINRQAVLISPGVLRLEERPCPMPGPHEVRLRPLLTGICGTDLALWRGTYAVDLPLVPGHEIVAEVDLCGSEVRAFHAGDRVVCEINATCVARRADGLCGACARGMTSHCVTRTVLGIIRHNGGMAERCIVPAGCLHRVPEGLPDEVAVFTEPVAAAFQTFVMAGDPRGRTVLVLGPGRLGLLIVAVARFLGGRVGVVGRSATSRDRALRFGAEVAFDADDPDLAIQVAHWSGGLGADFVVEATGHASQAGRALDMVRPRGTIAIKSTPGVSAPLDLTRVAVNEISLVGSRCGPFPLALEWLLDPSAPIASLVAATLPLARIEEAMLLAETSTKVLIAPNAQV